MPVQESESQVDEARTEETQDKAAADEASSADTEATSDEAAEDNAEAAEADTDADSSEESEGDEDPEDEADEADGSGVARALRKKNRENQKLRQRAQTAELKARQYEAAAQVGLPLDVAKRLTGNTLEELIKDAEELKQLIGGRVPGIRDTPRDESKPTAPTKPVDLAKIGAKIYAH